MEQARHGLSLQRHGVLDRAAGGEGREKKKEAAPETKSREAKMQIA